MFKIFQICFLLFMFYSSCGWLMEVLNTIRVEKRFVNRGFLIGPYCPIYGCGVLLMSIFLKKYIDDIFLTFVFSILICGVLEYITSFVLEKIFNARWWDYSKRKFNINGRVCLENLLIFGLLGLYITYISNPFLLGLLNTVSDIILNIVTIIIFIIFAIDIGISTNIISSPIHFIFCHGIIISLLEEKKLINLEEPGTIIDVITPVSKSAFTS